MPPLGARMPRERPRQCPVERPLHYGGRAGSAPPEGADARDQLVEGERLAEVVLQAELLAKGAYNSLLLGLGAVALLVGGVGIANVMVISVLERRSEMGLRRALGATRRPVAEQFLAEAQLLSALGGMAGTVIGVSATAIYAHTEHWQVQIPAQARYGGTGAALAIGAIAGL